MWLVFLKRKIVSIQTVLYVSYHNYVRIKSSETCNQLIKEDG